MQTVQTIQYTEQPKEISNGVQNSVTGIFKTFQTSQQSI
jgi:hypothetical protein